MLEKEAAEALLRADAQARVDRCIEKCRKALEEENVRMEPQILFRGSNIHTEVIFTPN